MSVQWAKKSSFTRRARRRGEEEAEISQRNALLSPRLRALRVKSCFFVQALDTHFRGAVLSSQFSVLSHREPSPSQDYSRVRDSSPSWFFPSQPLVQHPPNRELRTGTQAITFKSLK